MIDKIDNMVKDFIPPITTTVVNPDGYRSLPDSHVVLLEGINKSGKDYVCNELLQEFAGQVVVVKWPQSKQIIVQIKALNKMLKDVLAKSNREAILNTIHDLFHVDFGLFDYRKLRLLTNKLIVFNRWMPSNIVYGRLHGVYRPHWYQNYGDLIPDYCYYLRVNQADYYRYINIFPTGINTFSTEEQVLSPDMLINSGQEFYDNVLPQMVMDKKLWGTETVKALRDDTYTHIRDDLLKKGWLV